MGLTTNLGLHSQTTRLCESASWNGKHHADGALTLSDGIFQWHLGVGSCRDSFSRLQFAGKPEIFKLDSSRFARRY